ncbi:DMT family transporter [Altericroceibacterium endophyticum]|uniref:EamA family transporter n=1 Tax=Altericroceibacterium endophyticum TaxID=1808508 RepID=A0A6I4T2A0_9SPHN|nr:DMT family transporter [Altericroceibacterium endophyticum]MXO64249.1 EamA family transporter [Altericroceibacterium endophyticum]
MEHSDRAGLLFVLAGFSLLAVGDAIIKGMTGMWPPTAMAATRYILGAIGLSAVLVARHGWQALWPMPVAHLQWVRGLAVATSSIAIFAAVWLMPLAEAITITFTQPMITAILAVLFLGEKLKRQTIIATIIAFVGVVLVLRPNFVEIGPAALLPLLAAIGMAVLIIANRATMNVGSVLAMQAYLSITAAIILFVATIIGHFSGIAALHMHWPAWHVFARCAFIAVSATLAHWMIYLGTTRAGASTVAPMTYGQLLMAVLLGWIFFDDIPDLVSFAGAAIIVGAGLYLWWSGRSRRAPKG